jgi:hypothetical protein
MISFRGSGLSGAQLKQRRRRHHGAVRSFRPRLTMIAFSSHHALGITRLSLALSGKIGHLEGELNGMTT